MPVFDLDMLPAEGGVAPYAPRYDGPPMLEPPTIAGTANQMVPYRGAQTPEFLDEVSPSGGSALSALLTRGGPWAAAIMEMLRATPTSANDTVSPSMAGARPEHPHSTGSMMPSIEAQYANQMPWRGDVAAPDYPTPPPRPSEASPVTRHPAQHVAGRGPQDYPMPPVRPSAAPAPVAADPGLGYYRAQSGNARGAPTYVSYDDLNDPRMYRGG